MIILRIPVTNHEIFICMLLIWISISVNSITFSFVFAGDLLNRNGHDITISEYNGSRQSTEVGRCIYISFDKLVYLLMWLAF